MLDEAGCRQTVAVVAAARNCDDVRRLMADRHPTIDIEAILADCDPLIRKRVRQKLGVTLSESDGSKRNQDALLLVYGSATFNPFKDLAEIQRGSITNTIINLRGYALTITDHAIATYLNDINPERRKLKDKVRYCLASRQGYAVWSDDGNRLLCGFANWQYQHETKPIPPW